MLSELKVLEMTDESGWFCGKLLADMGADVIRLEKPGQTPVP
jgi:crotonobetainyl-CoA:carnitine CoA-transferase CaiB-like acyl-CoA transferase